jgi:hypothetical protein
MVFLMRVRGVVIENGSGHRARFLSEACES